MNTGGQQQRTSTTNSSSSMHGKKSTGLLLITNLHSLLGVEQLLKASISHVKNRLYVALHDRVVEDLHRNRLNGLSSIIDFVCNCYRVAGLSTLSSTDVRVLLENVKDSKTGASKLMEKLARIDCVILDRPTNDSNFIIDPSNTGTGTGTSSATTSSTGGSTSSLYKKLLSAELRYLNLQATPPSTLHQQQPHFKMDEFKVCLHNGVVLGGTFDRLHNGHKFLLSTSALLAKCNLTCGVTDGVMLENKLLYELMEPIERRIAAVREFVEDVDSSLTYKIVPIYDPFGPSTVDTNLQGIVVSKETLRGAVKVNEGRAKNNLNQLKIHVIDLLDDDVKDEETKISSSKIRKKLLGKLLREPKVKGDIPSPYIVGLSGGICSGKTHIAQYLEEFGAQIIDCDKLGHQAYLVGTRAYQKIIEEFGNDVIDKSNNNAINRKVLGAKVFSDKQKLEKLNSIVWPEIERLAKEQISLAVRNKKRVVVLDAAVLLEAGWDSVVHEIWVPIVPFKEAVRRIKERNKLSEEEAVQRVKSQLSNSDRVKKAHVVFCSLWDYAVTKAQVKFAWNELQRRINTNAKDKDSVSSSSSTKI